MAKGYRKMQDGGQSGTSVYAIVVLDLKVKNHETRLLSALTVAVVVVMVRSIQIGPNYTRRGGVFFWKKGSKL